MGLNDTYGAPNNLMPPLSQVAVGRRDYLNVFGNDYPNRDGTGVRDFIHFLDLALFTLASVRYDWYGRPWEALHQVTAWAFTLTLCDSTFR